MKIDILGQFRDVVRLTQLPTAPAPRTAEFDNVLTTESQKPEASPQVRSTTASAREVPFEIHASLQLKEPELLAPSPERLSPKIQEPQPPVNVPEASVKTPTVVEAKRVSFENPFAGMSRSERESAVAALVTKAGQRHGVDPALSMSVIKAESAFDAHAVSSDGHFSKGLMQLLDSTGEEQLDAVDARASYQPFNPNLNVDLGVRYLRKLHDLFATSAPIANGLESIAAANSSSLEKLAVAAYNAGQGRVASAQQRAKRDGKDPAEYDQVETYLPQSTQEYVRTVLASRAQFEPHFGLAMRGEGEGKE